jgi:type I restriction enzyme S subunit
MLAAFDENAVETYRRTYSVVFRRTNERFGGLSNMAAGFPLRINGIEIRTAEAIYQAARFPHLPELQRDILAQASPMAAKMKGKPLRRESRPDFDANRVSIMWWTLRVKLACNPDRFSQLLAATGEQPIVEDSHKDTYWGAVAMKDDPAQLRGANVLGRLLIALRDVVATVEPHIWQVVHPPAIPGFTLFGEPIRVIDGSSIDRRSGAAKRLGYHR